VYVGTAPEKPPPDPEAPHPGAFRDTQAITLEAGKTHELKLTYKPLDVSFLKGEHSASIRIVKPDGNAAAGQSYAIFGSIPNFGQVRMHEDKLPDSGTIQLDGLAAGKDDPISYRVDVNGKYVGSIKLKDSEKRHTFEFHLTPETGDLAPDILLRDVFEKREVKLSSFKGQVVFLEFWATWCGPCQTPMRKLNGLAREHKDAWKGKVAVLGLSIDESPATAEQHIRQRGWTAVQQYWAGKGSTASDAGRKYALHGVPEALLIDQKGKIVWRGHPSSIDLVAEVAKLGANPPAE
jgi:thiol-disulfide isomerase/thioredoxin